MSWEDKPLIFNEDGTPATFNPRFQQQWQEEQQELQDEAEVFRICPWCGVLCESIAALAVHEEGCD